MSTITTSSALDTYKSELIEHAMTIGALKFGSFVLKSGRTSPYFFNAGLLSSGPILHTLASAYAATLSTALNNKTAEPSLPSFDVIFGPAYKGIPFAAVTTVILHTQYALDIGLAYDRKEVKAHGEGGQMVGVDVAGKRVVVLDDVMTAGTAVRKAILAVRQSGGEVVGVIQALDREERGGLGGLSAVEEIEELIGKGRVLSILKMSDLITWLDRKEMREELRHMEAYREEYGIRNN